MVAPTIQFHDGYKMPIIGLGTFESKTNEVGEAVKDAIDTGYRHFDCGYLYRNEQEIGNAIREKIDDGVVTREELFITTKVWCTSRSQHLVVPACKKSLENLGLEYIDLYLIHTPFAFKEGADEFFPIENNVLQFSDVDYLDTWKGMEECVKLGLVRSIGLSNFNHKQIERVLEIASIKPVNNQVEANPNINQTKLRDYCKEHDIVLTAYGPLGKPGAVKGMAFNENMPEPSMKNLQIIEFGEKYDKTPAQIILRYLIQHETYPLPKSCTKSRIIENFEIFDFELSDEEMNYIDSLDTNSRVYTMGFAKDHPHYPFDAEY